jgi:hypothetical protein
MRTRHLLIVTALVEAPAGIVLLLSPPLLAGLLFGASASLEAPAAMVVARIAGAALLALSLACWLARADRPGPTQRGLIAAMLLYHGAAVAVLVYTAAVAGLAGVLLWPAVVLHVALAAWCIAVRRTA